MTERCPGCLLLPFCKNKSGHQSLIFSQDYHVIFLKRNCTYLPTRWIYDSTVFGKSKLITLATFWKSTPLDTPYSLSLALKTQQNSQHSVQMQFLNRLVLPSNIWRHGLRHIMWSFQCGCKHSLFRRFKCIYWNGKISTSAVQLNIKLFFHW